MDSVEITNPNSNPSIENMALVVTVNFFVSTSGLL